MGMHFGACARAAESRKDRRRVTRPELMRSEYAGLVVLRAKEKGIYAPPTLIKYIPQPPRKIYAYTSSLFSSDARLCTSHRARMRTRVFPARSWSESEEDLERSII